MDETINFSDRIKRQMPAELVEFLQHAGDASVSLGQQLYLVGGIVRDLLIERDNLDLDLVVEGDAASLARQLADATHGKVIPHPSFLTAKLRWDNWSVDLATARTETYARPGALPTVKPGSISTDLFRRDFTINAMAVELTAGHYGLLIDPYGGKDDLDRKLVRILHEKSFVDDATRIWRGIRYEQRLDFQLEPDTLKLLLRDVPMLDTLSGDRIRHELERILKEELPEKVLRRADELGVLARMHPAIKGDDWLVEKFRQARSENSNLPTLYMALLAYRLSDEESEELISKLSLPKSLSETLRDTGRIKAWYESLSDPGLAPSSLFKILKDYSLPAIMAHYLANDDPVLREHIHIFLSRLRYVKSSLTGADLQKMGIKPGPRMKEILQRLLDARLDGRIKTKKEEEEMVKSWVGKEN